MKRRILAGLLVSAMALGTTGTAVFAETADTDTAAVSEEDSSLGGLLGKIFSDEEVQEALFGEEGAVNQLFGENGALKDMIPEGKDVKGLLDGLGEQLGDKKNAIYDAIDGVASAVTNEDGTLNTEALGNMAESLLGGLFGSDKADEETVEEYSEFDDIEALNWAGMAYVVEQNAGLLKEGDVEIDNPYNIAYLKGEDNTITSLGAFTQKSYTADGDTLKVLAELSDVWLVKVKTAEDGTFTVEEGQKVDISDEAALTEACKAVGITTDDFINTVATSDELMEISRLLEFLEKNTEYTGIQYGDEICTKEELGARMEEVIDNLFSGILGQLDDLAEETGEAVQEAGGAVDSAIQDAAGAVDEAVQEVENAVADAAGEVKEAVDTATEEVATVVMSEETAE